MDDINSDIITIGIVCENFDYESAANDCVDTLMYRFEEIYDDWQSNLDDDKVWWDNEFRKTLVPVVTHLLKSHTDFSVQKKAYPICQYNLKTNEII